MDERAEKISSISRVLPVRKVALVRPRRGGRELMYQLNQKNQKFRKNKLDTKTISHGSLSTGSSTVSSSNEYALDLKKRIAFDRAMIIGE